MAATADTITTHLTRGPGLVVDPLCENDGAVLAHGFMLGQNLATRNHQDEANIMFEELSARANALGMFSARVDPVSGDLLGSFPDPATHAAALACAVACARISR